MTRAIALSLLLGLGGCALTAFGWFAAHPAQLASLLWSTWFWLNLSLGCIGLRLVHRLSGGEWGHSAAPVFNAAAAALPLAMVPLLLLLLDLPTLFPWAAPPEQLSHAVRAKAAWLNADFFNLRILSMLAAWLVLAQLAVRQRLGTAPAAGLLIAHVLLGSLLAFDWMMSLDPEWYSSIAGLLIVSAQALAAGGLVLLTLNLPSNAPAAVDAKPRIDLANLTMAMSLLWIYLAFSQYLIIWSADLPHETHWYLDRSTHGWVAVGVASLALQFALPFAALVSRTVKADTRALGAVGICLLAGHLLYMAWLTQPRLRAAWPHWTDLAAFAAVGGPWTALYLHRLRAHAPQPQPRARPLHSARGGVFVPAFVAVLLLLGLATWLAAPLVTRVTPPRPTPPADAPALQANPRLDRQHLEAQARAQLDSYGWIDRDAGIVHLPIQRAMQLLLQRDPERVFASAAKEAPR